MRMRLLYVPLTATALDRLCALAEREHREPRKQAAYLLERALDAGHDTDELAIVREATTRPRGLVLSPVDAAAECRSP